MTTIQKKMKNYCLIVSGFVLLCIVGYLTSPFQSQFLGFMVGLLLSLLSLWTTYRKSILIGETASGMKNHTTFSYVAAGFGFVIRIALALLGVWLAIANPDHLDLISVITGFA
ncbi:ATP synthase subunit I [Bacillus sp. JCM 19034]|uniref:ATP synthase subunit I n=1 Tax=Bacillus sp. JCM 19034 TaxID=1481928 RepID=UPI000781CC2F|nr:ATP synthase subunit I [Bacillus sp. JCM 19034]